MRSARPARTAGAAAPLTLAGLLLASCAGGVQERAPGAGETKEAEAAMPADERTEGTPETAEPAEAGEWTALDLRFDETAEHGELRIRWLDLQDSRCPIGVTCIWEGEAVVTLELAAAGETRRMKLTLRGGAEPSPATAPSAAAFGYRLRLRAVDPYPREGVRTERADYVARLEIRAD